MNTSSPAKVNRILEELVANTDAVVGWSARRAGIDSHPPPSVDNAPSNTHDQRMSDVTRDELDAKLGRTEARVEASLSRIDGDLREMRAEMREGFRGVRHTQTISAGFIAILVAIGLAGTGYVLSRIDGLDRRMDALPSQISAELRDITSTLSEAITAAGNRQPVIIQVPQQAPTAPPEPPPE